MLRLTVPSSETGATNTEIHEGLSVYELDEILDRSEVGTLIAAHHHAFLAIVNMDGAAPTEVGRATAHIEVATAASLQMDPSMNVSGNPATLQSGNQGNFDANIGTVHSDSLDVMGRPLRLDLVQTFRDAVNQAGGAASNPTDRWDGPVADPQFHPRDAVFVNTEFGIDNINDPGIEFTITGQHLYGVEEQ